MSLISRESYDPRVFTLDDSDWRWLGNKRSLVVAVWQPEIPPLYLYSGEGRYEGMIADYISLLGEYLGLRVEVKAFASREAALSALAQKHVDIVADPSAKDLPFSHSLVSSPNFISDHPVLVHRKKTRNAPFRYEEGMRLAIARWYVDDSWIEQNFPGAAISHFDTDDQAMASVAFDENDFYIGNLVTASYLLERNYPHYLMFQQVYPERDTGSHFVMRKEDEVLTRSVGRVLTAIPRTQNQVILQQWSERANLWKVSKKVEFTAAEKKWLAANPTAKVSVNAFYAPFTMIDASGGFYGVTADILRMIRLRTGLHFDPVSADSVNTMEGQILSKKALFIGAVSESEERNQNLLFSRPYFSSPFVLIEALDKNYSGTLPAGTRVAVVSKNILIPELQRQNPGIQIIETANASIAMQKVEDGKADVAVHTLFGASYMIDRYFRDRLKIGGRVGDQTAKIAFAVSRDQPELLSIINKSLENISPADISSIIDKWQTRPDVRLDTWELYKTRFWLVFAVAGIMILTSLIWIYYLRREIGARQLAQQKLQSQLAYNETLTRALSEETERAEQANRAKSTFLATMSHEIRTPVSAIIGLLELTVNTTGKQLEDEDPVRVAWESARSLMGLIGDILDMARIESGRLELAPEWVRTSELLPPVVRVFEGLARQKSLRLHCTLPQQLPYQVFIDPLRFRQVLSNLISNAIKFTDQGSITVEIAIREGTISESTLLQVCVADTGKGISHEEQKDIFDPWVQAKNGTTQSGSGLGLAICSQLVHMMDGTIDMTSETDKGTKVSYTVPVQTRGKQPERALSATINEAPVPHLALRILAVDDHPANLMLLRRQLTHLGHHVTEARNGVEAWDLWHKEPFDMVITDCSMPGMDGLTLTRLIRDLAGDSVMILGLTANAWPEERTRCQAAGMNDCLFKPLQLAQLKTILTHVAKTLPEKADNINPLKNLVDYQKLQQLSDFDDDMLRELLSLTLNSNRDDLIQAKDLLELQDWPELAKCIHRISGAAKICGAGRVELACRKLESACLLHDHDDAEIGELWPDVSASLGEFNLAIESWLKNNDLTASRSLR
ncbi:response regulator [Rahnella woolbedingensis]|uniref:histidine kinase n=2 Tax=Rahnella woolbedingensis TaxID=1510574 RepID=A0A419N3B7_9GAMM|nr:response regulator [Rahnella woolbedingensis]